MDGYRVTLRFPRDGAFLLVANQATNNIVTFKIDPGTGQLLDTGYKVDVPMPVCLKFAQLKL